MALPYSFRNIECGTGNLPRGVTRVVLPADCIVGYRDMDRRGHMKDGDSGIDHMEDRGNGSDIESCSAENSTPEEVEHSSIHATIFKPQVKNMQDFYLGSYIHVMKVVSKYPTH